MHFLQCIGPFFVYKCNKICFEIKLSKTLRELLKLSLTIKRSGAILCINDKAKADNKK